MCTLCIFRPIAFSPPTQNISMKHPLQLQRYPIVFLQCWWTTFVCFDSLHIGQALACGLLVSPLTSGLGVNQVHFYPSPRRKIYLVLFVIWRACTICEWGGFLEQCHQRHKPAIQAFLEKKKRTPSKTKKADTRIAQPIFLYKCGKLSELVCHTWTDVAHYEKKKKKKTAEQTSTKGQSIRFYRSVWPFLLFCNGLYQFKYIFFFTAGPPSKQWYHSQGHQYLIHSAKLLFCCSRKEI